MRSFYSAFAIGALALGLGACSQDATGPFDPQFAKIKDEPVSSPTGPTLKVYVGGTISFRTSGIGNNGSGVCLSGGRWQRDALISAGPHPNCAIINGGSPVVVSVDATGRANRSLVGDDGQIIVEPGKNSVRTSGFFTSVDGSWLIANQPLLNDVGNFYNPTGMVVLTSSSTLGTHPGLLIF